MINKVLLEHETPSLDYVKESLLERTPINTKPFIEHTDGVDLLHLTVDLFISINLMESKSQLNFFESKFQLNFFLIVLLNMRSKASLFT